MKEKLLLVLFFVIVVGGFVSITLSVTKLFVANVNSVTLLFRDATIDPRRFAVYAARRDDISEQSQALGNADRVRLRLACCFNAETIGRDLRDGHFRAIVCVISHSS